MTTQYPPIQVVNEADEPIGEASLHEIHANGLIFRAIWTFVEDTDGALLLQQRSPHVATDQNRWDFSSAGHVDAGENYETAAHRELEEELGLVNCTLQVLQKLRGKVIDGPRTMDRFVTIFKTQVAAGTPIVYPEEEVQAVKWASPAEVRGLMADAPESFTANFKEYFAYYYPSENP